MSIIEKKWSLIERIKAIKEHDTLNMESLTPLLNDVENILIDDVKFAGMFDENQLGHYSDTDRENSSKADQQEISKWMENNRLNYVMDESSDRGKVCEIPSEQLITIENKMYKKLEALKKIDALQKQLGKVEKLEDVFPVEDKDLMEELEVD